MNMQCTALALILQVIAERYILLFLFESNRLSPNETEIHVHFITHISMDSFID